jgi:uncharacterized oxidoreductase
VAPRAFFSELSRFIEFVKSSRTVAPGGEILVPGEPERRTKAERMKKGIELDETTCSQIASTCRALHVDATFLCEGVMASEKTYGNLHIPGTNS